jgi:CubicO group peptidase (beta-lactamase class C family)
MQAFAKMPMDFPPGEKWSYSNAGYVLPGIIIHRVTGEFYGDFLQERIFRPLGMTSTRIHQRSGYRRRLPLLIFQCAFNQAVAAAAVRKR